MFWRDADGRGWFWESEPDGLEYHLVNRDGKLAARIEASVGARWRLTHPMTIPVLVAPNLDAGKRLAISMALANLPLDAAIAAKAERFNATVPMMRAQSQPHAGMFNFRIAESRAPGDPGPIPDFLQLTAEQRRAGWERYHAERGRKLAVTESPGIAPDHGESVPQKVAP
jgi:hypothetical protein